MQGELKFLDTPTPNPSPQGGGEQREARINASSPLVGEGRVGGTA